MTPHIAALHIHPFKSFDVLPVTSATVQPSGALALDRRWAFVDDAGKVWNAKRTVAIPQMRCRYDSAEDVFRFTFADQTTVDWRSGSDPTDLEAMVGRSLGGTARLVENREVGFPDDLDSPGPTIVSTATLETVASWFPGLTLENVRARFRANIEIGGVPPFWEDRLYRAEGVGPAIRLGPQVTLLGVNPCQRCAVPSRDPWTAAVLPGFQKRFSELRQQSLPPWAARERFNHFYRLTVNTRLGTPGTIHVGDDVLVDAD
jgi:hypothetical protein